MKGAIRAQKLGLISVIAGAIAMSAPQAAAAATSGGVKITLTCEVGTAGKGTFKVTANGSSSLVTVPCDGSATVTNPSGIPGATATIDQTAGPVGTVLAKTSVCTLRLMPLRFLRRRMRAPRRLQLQNARLRAGRHAGRRACPGGCSPALSASSS